MYIVPLPMPTACCECEHCTCDMECGLLDYKTIEVDKLEECPLREYKGE